MAFSRTHLIGFAFILMLLAVACAPVPAPAPATIPPETIPPTSNIHGAPMDGFDLYTDIASLLSQSGFLLPGVEVSAVEMDTEQIDQFSIE